jgi:hypothetical protein
VTRRSAAWVLIVYGLLGITLLAVGAVVGVDLAGRLERTAQAAEGTLAAAARSTRAAASAFTTADGSLENAQVSASDASDLARDAGATLDSLALAMGISILGSRPLQPLAAEFSASADQATQLSDTLRTVAESLADTRTDVTAIGTELESLADELDNLQGAGEPSGAAAPLRLFIGLLVAWLAIPAVGALVAGLGLLRRPRDVAV